MKTLKFSGSDPQQQKFAAALRKNVHDYFKSHSLSTKGDARMYLKAVVMLSLYIAPFVFLLTIPVNAGMAVLLLLIMGIGMAGVGMSVMHDAVHGAFSSVKWVNTILGSTIYLLGSSKITWTIQHNFLHHAYTNITGFDEDIETKGFMRMSKNEPRRRYQRYQHIYAFFFYGFMTLAKLVGDFSQLIKYNKAGLAAGLHHNPSKEVIRMIVTKLIYLAVIIGLPMWLTDFTWWQVMIGFFIMHMVGGMIMSTIFQMAHVVEDTDQPMPAADGTIGNEWTVHQLSTTSDFAPANMLLSWYVGGLNFQVEHHLFSNICHVHYKKIAPIVERTAQEFGYTYKVKRTFGNALVSHVRTLKRLGNPS